MNHTILNIKNCKRKCLVLMKMELKLERECMIRTENLSIPKLKISLEDIIKTKDIIKKWDYHF